MSVRLGITAKLTLLFVLFAAVLLAGVGLLAYNSGRSALESATTFELLSTALEKEAALNAWLEDRRLNIAVLANSPDIQDHATSFIATPNQATHDRLIQSLQAWTGDEHQYLDLLVIEAETGRVVAATDPGEEGKFKENLPFFIQGRNGPYIQNVYYSLELEQPAMTASAPLYAPEGGLAGVLAGRLNLEEMNTIIGRRAGFHETDESFLVNTSHLFVTQPRFITNPAVLRRGNYSEAVKSCLNQESGVISNEDYRGVPVITAYRWLAGRQLCLIVKLDRAEALAPTQAFGRTILLIGSLALLVALILAIGLARTITQPVLALQQGAARFGQGDLQVRLPVTTGDELSQLAQEFNLMATVLAEKESQLRRHTEELEELVWKRTAALQESETLYRTLVETSPDAIILTDLEANILLANQKAVQLFGFGPKEEVIGLNFFELIKAEDRSQAIQKVQKSIEFGSITDLEYTLVNHDGSHFPAELSASLIKDLAGRPRRFINVVRDITERKRVEEMLRTRIRQQAVVAELGQLALKEPNIDNLMERTVTLVAQTLETEYTKVLELLPEGDTLFLRAGVGWQAGLVGQATVGAGRDSQAGYTLLSGEPVIVADLRSEQRFSGPPLLHEHGVISGISTIIPGQDQPFGVLGAHTGQQRIFTRHDANFIQAVANVLAGAIERKQAEETITQSLEREQIVRAEVELIREHLAFLAEASKILASSMDYQTTLSTVAHLAVPDIADWCAVDILDAGGSLKRVAVAHVDPDKVEYAYELQRRYPFDPDAPQGVANVLRTGQPEFYPQISEAVLEAIGADQEQLAIIRQLGLRSAITVPLRTYERVLGVITLVWAESGHYYSEVDLDLAEELARRAGVAVENARLYQESQRLNIELENRVRERTASLEAANKELEAFSYTVSHDLRSPLRAIDGFSRVLLEHYSPQLEADAQRYLRLVRHGAQQMGQLIDDLLTFSRLNRQPLRKQQVDPADLIHQVLEALRSEQEGRQVEITINDLPPYQADAALLKQVWFNLLSNALKYTRQREQVKIEIGYRQDGEQPAYFVKDNGVGFDMAYVHKLFGVFQRLHLAEEYEGTGVGLALVQRIIHRHGGRVWAEAEIDQGATFYFTLNEGTHHD